MGFYLEDNKVENKADNPERSNGRRFGGRKVRDLAEEVIESDGAIIKISRGIYGGNHCVEIGLSGNRSGYILAIYSPESGEVLFEESRGSETICDYREEIVRMASDKVTMAYATRIIDELKSEEDEERMRRFAEL
jgi:hypothetical protein